MARSHRAPDGDVRVAALIACEDPMRFALFGLLLAAIVFVASGGHVVFLPLFFVLPLGGLFAHRRTRRW